MLKIKQISVELTLCSFKFSRVNIFDVIWDLCSKTRCRRRHLYVINTLINFCLIFQKDLLKRIFSVDVIRFVVSFFFFETWDYFCFFHSTQEIRQNFDVVDVSNLSTMKNCFDYCDHNEVITKIQKHCEERIWDKIFVFFSHFRDVWSQSLNWCR